MLVYTPLERDIQSNITIRVFVESLSTLMCAKGWKKVMLVHASPSPPPQWVKEGGWASPETAHIPKNNLRRSIFTTFYYNNYYKQHKNTERLKPNSRLRRKGWEFQKREKLLNFLPGRCSNNIITRLIRTTFLSQYWIRFNLSNEEWREFYLQHRSSAPAPPCHGVDKNANQLRSYRL